MVLARRAAGRGGRRRRWSVVARWGREGRRTRKRTPRGGVGEFRPGALASWPCAACACACGLWGGIFWELGGVVWLSPPFSFSLCCSELSRLLCYLSLHCLSSHSLTVTHRSAVLFIHINLHQSSMQSRPANYHQPTEQAVCCV